MSTQFALIGHSGAGKTSCLKQLGFSPNKADMDNALGTKQRPSLSRLREWFSDPDTPVLVAASIHGPFQDWFEDIKLAGVAKLIYLCKPKEQIAEHVRDRCIQDQETTLNTYDALDVIFRVFAKYVIYCATKDVATVGSEVSRIIYNAK